MVCMCVEMCGVHVQLFHFPSCPHLHQPDNGDYWVRYVTLLLCRARRDLTAIPSPPPYLPSLNAVLCTVWGGGKEVQSAQGEEKQGGCGMRGMSH